MERVGIKRGLSDYGKTMDRIGHQRVETHIVGKGRGQPERKAGWAEWEEWMIEYVTDGQNERSKVEFSYFPLCIED